MTSKRTTSATTVLILVLVAGLMVGATSGCSSAGGLAAPPGSGDLLAPNETYDTVRDGARLILVYDKQSNSFVGTVENTTSGTLRGVRVEVHLSNGVELGPTTPIDLAPGEKVDVFLLATVEVFDGWTPHAEVDGGAGREHGNGGQEGDEHGRGGEHGSGGKGG